MEAEILDLSVGEFSRRFATTIKGIRKLQRIAIRGEVSKWSPQSNGNLYFTLKDADSALACFAFPSGVKRFPKVADGVSVRAIGSIGVREQRSEYQLLVEELELTGIGELAAQVEALRERLQSEGAFDESRRRPIPRYARRVALISAAGDAKEDFEKIVRERAPNVEVTFFLTRVQGKGADIEIAEAFDRASQADVDVIVLTRGGGSYEDRFAFNLEPVVRAILRSRHPVITAIGHAPDFHLADAVADYSAPTPTAAAEHIVADWVRTFDRLARARADLSRGLRDVLLRVTQRSDSNGFRLGQSLERRIASDRLRISTLQQRLAAVSPVAQLAQQRAASVAKATGLDRVRERLVSDWKRRVERAEAGLDKIDPQSPLERGYAIVTKGGHTVRDAGELAPGDEIAARLYRGTVAARVEGTSNDE
jgi:exodeoxyribonuclease VII large subunit